MSYVLIVDDEPDSSEFVERFLRRSGYRVACVPNGRAALTSLMADYPDALVLDVRMPEMDGIALLEVLRSYLRWKTLPVILLTAHADAAQVARARELGVAYIFRKASFSLPDLVAALDAVTSQPPTTSAWKHTPKDPSAS
jgi:DNA-binding response OmpR family regulator